MVLKKEEDCYIFLWVLRVFSESPSLMSAGFIPVAWVIQKQNPVPDGFHSNQSQFPSYRPPPESLFSQLVIYFMLKTHSNLFCSLMSYAVYPTTELPCNRSIHKNF